MLFRSPVKIQKVGYMRLYLFIIIVFNLSFSNLYSRPLSHLSGKIVNEDNQPVEFATVYIKGTKFTTLSNEKGVYHLKVPQGKSIICVSYMGYKEWEKEIDITTNERNILDIKLISEVNKLDEVIVSASQVDRVKGSAFHAVAIDAKQMHNNSAELTNALAKLPGIKVRESGGVGSDMQFSLDGFTGKQIGRAHV